MIYINYPSNLFIVYYFIGIISILSERNILIVGTIVSFEKFRTKIEIISDDIKEKSIQEELAEDIISIIHSFSEKLYGMRNKLIKKSK
ncbi:hypothetical protein [Leptotrichia trevisanii]